MSKLEKLQSVVSEPMSRFKDLYCESLKSDNASVNQAVDYIIKMQGKHMRPLLTLLSAGLCGQINERAITSAVLVELTHTASLIHDDIVDEAYQRRSMWSVGALWRSRSAVLLGDYVLSRGITLATGAKMYDILGLVGSVVERMSKGELLQSDYALSLDIDRKGYFEVIDSKTASLISISAASGAISADASSHVVDKLSRFGLLIGEAFQIKDDILDYTATSSIGKPVCNDIAERKITLPLIAALEKVTASERKKILDLVRDSHSSAQARLMVRDFVIEHDGHTESYKVMDELKKEAVAQLDDIADSIYKEAIIGFADYTLSREK